MNEPPLHGDINRAHDGGSRMVVTRSGRLVAAEELQRRRAEIEDARNRRLARTMKRLFRKPRGRLPRRTTPPRPTPGATRPADRAGAVTFHFAHSAITADPARAGRAAEHQRYIERGGMDLEDTDPAGSANAYIERDGAVERDRSGRPTVITNIGDDFRERFQFWNRVNRIESEAVGTLGIKLHPAHSGEWWAEARDDPLIPPAAEKMFAAFDEIKRPKKRGRKPNPNKPVTVALTPDEVTQVMDWAKTVREWKNRKAPLVATQPRHGRVQSRIIAELPCELTADQRRQLVEDFTKELERHGFPYVAVVHRPEAGNDERNYHLHLAYYDRPAKRRPSGLWDFEVEPGPDIDGRKPKPDWVTRKGWVVGLRRRYCELMNEHLARAGIDKRHFAESYAAKGIERTPARHMGYNHAVIADEEKPPAADKEVPGAEKAPDIQPLTEADKEELAEAGRWVAMVDLWQARGLIDRARHAVLHRLAETSRKSREPLAKVKIARRQHQDVTRRMVSIAWHAKSRAEEALARLRTDGDDGRSARYRETAATLAEAEARIQRIRDLRSGEWAELEERYAAAREELAKAKEAEARLERVGRLIDDGLPLPPAGELEAATPVRPHPRKGPPSPVATPRTEATESEPSPEPAAPKMPRMGKAPPRPTQTPLAKETGAESLTEERHPESTSGFPEPLAKPAIPKWARLGKGPSPTRRAPSADQAEAEAHNNAKDASELPAPSSEPARPKMPRKGKGPPRTTHTDAHRLAKLDRDRGR